MAAGSLSTMMDFLYISVGDRGKENENPQNLLSDCGKVHRLNPDGSIPTDNPFYNQANANKSIFTYGHRNPQGMAFNVAQDRIWVNEHGPRGETEVNILNAGANYGWPLTCLVLTMMEQQLPMTRQRKESAIRK